MSSATDTTNTPLPNESPAAFATRHGIVLNKPLPPTPEPPVAEDGGPPVELRSDAHEPAPFDPHRREALDLARTLRAPGHVGVDEAIEAWNLHPQREQQQAENLVTARERSSDRLADGSPGALKAARGIYASALAKLEQIAVEEAVAHKNIDGDPDTSAAGKQKRHGEKRREFDAKRAEATGELLSRADRLLDLREAALSRTWAEAHAAPAEATVEEKLLDTMRVANLLAVSKAGGSNSKMIELVHRAADAGDAVLAGGLLELLAIGGSDVLLIRQATLLLRPRVEALRAAAFDPKSREVAAELTMLHRARSGLKAVRDFVAQYPGEPDLAQQRLNKVFPWLE